MIKKLLLTLFIINTALLLLMIFPVLQGLISIFYSSHAGAIGIIGGKDGPTAIFITSDFKWIPVALVVIEIILAVSLYLTRSKK